MPGKYKSMNEDAELKVSKPKATPKNGKIKRVVIEPAGNGYIVRCEYKAEPKAGSVYAEPTHEEPSIATDLDSLYALLARKLG